MRSMKNIQLQIIDLHYSVAQNTWCAIPIQNVSLYSISKSTEADKTPLGQKGGIFLA